MAEKVPTREGYDRWSEVYDHDDNPLIALETPVVSAMLGDVAGLEVADIGCGTGRHAIPVARAGADVTAVDFSEGMLARARAKAAGVAKLRFVQHDFLGSLPLDDAGFDRVLCCLVLDHVPDLPRFFRELGRVCRPEGFIVVSIMHPAMMLRGRSAGFFDPQTGDEVSVQSSPHQICEYVMGVVGAGLRIEEFKEYAVDRATADRCPRAEKYLDWPMLVTMKLRAGTDHS